MPCYEALLNRLKRMRKYADRAPKELMAVVVLGLNKVSGRNGVVFVVRSTGSCLGISRPWSTRTVDVTLVICLSPECSLRDKERIGSQKRINSDADINFRNSASMLHVQKLNATKWLL